MASTRKATMRGVKFDKDLHLTFEEVQLLVYTLCGYNLQDVFYELEKPYKELVDLKDSIIHKFKTYKLKHFPERKINDTVVMIEYLQMMYELSETDQVFIFESILDEINYPFILNNLKTQ